MSIRKKKIALVIGAGSVKCAAALGLWNVLEKEDIHFDMIVGCSGGSLYAASMALGFSLDESVAKSNSFRNKSTTEKRNWRGLFSAVLPGLFGFNEKFSMIDDSRMLTRLHEVFGEKT